MSLSAALLLAAASAGTPPAPEALRGAAVAQSRVTATILRGVTVRRTGGQVRAGTSAPHHQIRRYGNKVLVEFQ